MDAESRKRGMTRHFCLKRLAGVWFSCTMRVHRADGSTVGRAISWKLLPYAQFRESFAGEGA